MTDPDTYTRDFVASALQALLEVLEKVRPGRLREFSLYRDDTGDRFECRFELHAQPGVEFVYYQGIRINGQEPQMSAESAAGVFFGALIERTASLRRPVDGRVDLMRRPEP